MLKLGFFQRISGHGRVQRRLQEIEQLLRAAEVDSAPLNANQRDFITIEYEDAFAGRFGFRWPRAARIAVLAIQKDYRLSDADVRTLYRGGNLRRKRHEVRFEADRVAAVLGWLQIGLLIAVYALPLSLSFEHWSTQWVLALKAVAVSVTLGAICWCTYWIQIFPWTLRKAAHR